MSWAVQFAAELERSVFPEPGTPVTCAVSGGADSAALVVLATAARCVVTVVHVDHGLRPSSAQEGEIVRALADSAGAAFRAEHTPVAPGPNLEARARHARYAVLPADVMTGHTADDQAETMLLNLIRGAGLEGMAGIRQDGRRPLLGLRRSDTLAICARAGITAIHDVMNDDPAYRRVRVRRELMPLLDEIADRDVTPVMARQAELFADDAAFLDGLAGEIDPTDAKAVNAAAPALARRAVRSLLRQGPAASHPPRRDTVERVLDVAAGRAVATDVGDGWRVCRTEQRLRLVAPAPDQERYDRCSDEF